jgi:hypothetical protein
MNPPHAPFTLALPFRQVSGYPTYHAKGFTARRPITNE